MPSPSDVRLRPFVAGDYPLARALWERSEGIGLNESDTEAAVASFLERNPGFSAVATAPDGALVGAVLCGHDGRRGYLHHLAVERDHRGRGLGRHLVAFCFERLAAAGISRCNIFVYGENEGGLGFWLREGWREAAWKTLQKPVEGAGERRRS